MSVLFISSGILVFGSIVFIIFGKGELQKWARDDQQLHNNDAELKNML